MEVQHDSCETRARLLSLDAQRLVTAHLRDGWADAELVPGDAVNLLAQLTAGDDGALTAVCDFRSGKAFDERSWEQCRADAGHEAVVTACHVMQHHRAQDAAYFLSYIAPVWQESVQRASSSTSSNLQAI